MRPQRCSASRITGINGESAAAKLLAAAPQSLLSSAAITEAPTRNRAAQRNEAARLVQARERAAALDDDEELPVATPVDMRSSLFAPSRSAGRESRSLRSPNVNMPHTSNGTGVRAGLAAPPALLVRQDQDSEERRRLDSLQHRTDERRTPTPRTMGCRQM